MKLFGIIIPFSLILIRYAAILFFGKNYEMYLDYQWTKFKMDFSKSYDSFEDELYHYEIFHNNLQKIEEHNKKYEAGIIKWKEGINQFSDLSEKEFQESGLVNLKLLEDNKVDSRLWEKDTHVMNGNAPDSIDWREFGVVTPVRIQGNCGCCWAIAAAGAVESHYAIKNKELIELSVQELIDCDTSRNNGCSGGLARAAFDYIAKNGLDTEKSYPYEAKNATCRKTKPKAITSGRTYVPYGERNLKDAVGTVGPVAISLQFRPMMSYEKGIFKCIEDMGNLFHAVLIVGYGEEEGVPYWLIKNSWGDKWGEKGYLRIQRVKTLSEPDCGVYSRTFYPNVEINEEENENE